MCDFARSGFGKPLIIIIIILFYFFVEGGGEGRASVVTHGFFTE